MEPCWETRRMHRNSTSVFTKQQRIATLAKRSPQMAFTSLAYLLDIDWLKEARAFRVTYWLFPRLRVVRWKCVWLV